MKRILTRTALAISALGFAACAATTSAPLPMNMIAASELAPDEEGADEWTSDCRQELGIDSGVANRAHLISSDEWVTGCFVNGDDVDGFALEVKTAAAATYQIEFVHRGGAAIEADIVAADGKSIASEALLEGTEINRSLTLAPGRYLIRVAKGSGAHSAWYGLKASIQTQVASK